MKLKPKVLGKTYFIKRDFSFNDKNVIYLITWTNVKMNT